MMEASQTVSAVLESPLPVQAQAPGILKHHITMIVSFENLTSMTYHAQAL
jgi:hypothetical protein